MSRLTRLIAPVAAAAIAAGFSSAGEAAGSIDRVVTLGDSYSSGQGIHADASDYDDHGPPTHSFDPATRLGGSTCHREDDTTPGPRLARQFGAESVFVACAGARIGHIDNQIDAAGIPAGGAGTLVAITIGGNDLRTVGGDDWPDVLIDCIFSSRCDRDGDNRLANLGDLRSDLLALYTSIGSDYPDATVRVLGYPRLTQRERWGCPGVIGVGRQEADWIDDQADQLNDTIESAVVSAARSTGADIAFVDVADEFDNHGSCRFWQRDRYVNDRVTGETYSRQLDPYGNVVDRYTDTWLTVSGASFHPSGKGYDAYYRALDAAV